MAIRAIIEDLEGVDEALRPLYRAGTEDEGLEGKHVLDVEGADGWAMENVTGLKTALTQEREQRADADKKLKAYGDTMPEQVAEMADKIKTFSEMDPEKDADRIVAQRVETIKADMQAAHETELARRDALSATYRGQALALTVDTAVDAALSQHKAKPAKRDMLAAHVRGFVDTIESDDNVITAVVMDRATGSKMYDKDGKPQDIVGLVKSLRDSAEHSDMFEPLEPGKSGTGSRQQQIPAPPGGVKTIGPGEMGANLEALAAGEAIVAQ